MRSVFQGIPKTTLIISSFLIVDYIKRVVKSRDTSRVSYCDIFFVIPHLIICLLEKIVFVLFFFLERVTKIPGDPDHMI